MFAFLFHFILVEGKRFLTFVFTFEFTVVVDSNYQMVKNFGDGICSQSGEHGVSLVGTFLKLVPPISSTVQFSTLNSCQTKIKSPLTTCYNWHSLQKGENEMLYVQNIYTIDECYYGLRLTGELPIKIDGKLVIFRGEDFLVEEDWEHNEDGKEIAIMTCDSTRYTATVEIEKNDELSIRLVDVVISDTNNKLNVQVQKTSDGLRVSKLY
ncbi:hypothetical protein [Aeromonas hydrophila]|uniref:hypothetical protein n=1 Tax=Aeromonas hydrophila TaxID=644 RepID=UPI0038D09F76